MTGIIRKIAWLHVQDRALLCVRSHGRELFYIPGGKPDPGEDDIAALVREIAEELGVVIARETIAPAGRFTAPADGKAGLAVAIDAYTAIHAGAFSPGHEIAQYRFLTSRDGALVSAATQIILQHLKVGNVID